MEEKNRMVLTATQQQLIISARGFTEATVISALNGGCRHIVQDIIQDAHLAVCRAARMFDPEAGCKFETFARGYIYSAIHSAKARYGFSVRIPEKYKRAMGIIHLQMSLDDDGNTPDDRILADDSETSATALQQQLEDDRRVERLLSMLTSKERKIVRQAFGFDSKPQSLPAIAKSMKMSANIIRRTYNEAMMKIDKGAKD